jgi:hypothetical protein
MPKLNSCFCGAVVFFFATTISAAGFDLRSGVVVDPAKGVAYLGTPSGGIEALDLSTGRPAWTSTAAALPLALNGKLLLARTQEAKPAARLPLVVFDDEGRKLLEAFAPLPKDVVGIVQDDPWRQFRATAVADGEGFVIEWTFVNRRNRGGSADSPEQGPRESRESGALRFDPRTGQSIAFANDVGVGEQPAPWEVAGVVASTEGGQGGPLVLKRRDAATGQQLPDRLLARQSIADLRSADGAYLMVSERVGAGGPDDPEYRWSVWSLDEGEKAGDVRRDVSASPFFVQKESLVFTAQPHGYRRGDSWIDEPLKIVSIRLSSGSPQWDRAIRDVTFRGPVPPGR